MKTRPAAVAGLFYEKNPVTLQAHIDSLIARVPAKQHPPPRALIVPHAGYIYSGEIAALAYARLRPLRQQIRRVALFGPAHRAYVSGMAVPKVTAFSTPLGDITLDRPAINTITGMPHVSFSNEAHQEEHSLEVQLPFLQTVLNNFVLTPVLVGQSEPEWVAPVMEALWGDPETLLVLSTDLSHFHPYEQALRLDTLTCERLLARERNLTGEDACGAHALNGLMHTRGGQVLEMELVGMCNSGDTAGDKKRVVGYGAFSLQ